MINSEEYWDGLYSQEEQNNQREKQTEFFINLVLENLPRWITEDIQDEHMSICDVGCAEGTGTELLAKQFQNSQVTGIDFSSNAVKVAKIRHPLCKYIVGDIKNLKGEYDIVFSSNVLEHFWHSKDVLEKMIVKAKKYCILLVPFREYYTVPEHATYFDFQSFPLEIQKKYKLCFYKPMTMQGEAIQYWFGEQILVIYGKNDYIQEKKLTLKNLYNGYVEERTKLIQQYDEKIKQYEKNKEVYCEQIVERTAQQINNLKKTVKKKQKQIIEYQEKIENFDHLIEKVIGEKEKELEEYKQKIADMSVDYNSVTEAIGRINETQESRVYRMSLIFRRFYVQCIASKDKKEFFKWLFSKIFHREYLGVQLNYFDYLESAKNKLKVIKPRMEELGLSNISSEYGLKRKDINKTVIIFASVPFYDVGGGQRSAQLAKTFNELGYIVHYIYGFECSEENVPDMYIPTSTHNYIDTINLEWYKNAITKDTIIIFEIPYSKFEPYLELAKRFGQHIVYEHIDNWDSNLGTMFYNENVFRKFLNMSDMITVTAKMLGEKIKKITDKKYHYLPNAVNINIFEPGKEYVCPKDLNIGKNKTLLYFGSLWGEWFDWEKIIYVAEKCKDITINLIGDYSGIKDKINTLPNNIYFLGLKKQTELPAYLQYADIAILPFKNCEIGKYVSPLKIFEYIAMNKKVLATELDDIQNYPNVYASDSKEQWVEIVNRDDEIVETDDFIAKNNWYSRCAEIIEEFNAIKKEFPEISVVVLNYNNKKVIERCVRTLLAHNKRYSYEVIVVDNGSSDGSYELLEQKYGKKIKLIRNEVNGCSSGRNLGVKYARGEYILFLDSDQWVVSDYWLDSALDLLENNVTIGAVAWNAGWFEKGKTYGPIVDYSPNRAIENANIWFRTDIAYLATSGFLMKKDLFEKVEGFDEFYDPTCFEDTDISLKIRNEGYEIAYCPYMAIMHLPHQTTQSGSEKHTQLMERNGEYFWNKWVSKNEKLLEYYKK